MLNQGTKILQESVHFASGDLRAISGNVLTLQLSHVTSSALCMEVSRNNNLGGVKIENI